VRAGRAHLRHPRTAAAEGALGAASSGEQSVSTPQAARAWAHTPCRHFNTQLADALALLSRPNPYLLRTKLSLLCSSSLFALRQLHVRGQYPKGGAVWLAVEERKRELKRQLRA
jgi:hypothetical protein